MRLHLRPSCRFAPLLQERRNCEQVTACRPRERAHGASGSSATLCVRKGHVPALPASPRGCLSLWCLRSTTESANLPLRWSTRRVRVARETRVLAATATRTRTASRAPAPRAPAHTSLPARARSEGDTGGAAKGRKGRPPRPNLGATKPRQNLFCLPLDLAGASPPHSWVSWPAPAGSSGAKTVWSRLIFLPVCAGRPLGGRFRRCRTTVWSLPVRSRPYRACSRSVG